MAAMRLALFVAVLLCAQALLSAARQHHRHGHRSRRQSSRSLTVFEALAKKIHLDTSAMSASCKVQFASSNSECLQVVYSCMTAGKDCDKYLVACRSSCKQGTHCNVSMKISSIIGGDLGHQPPTPFCFPKACQGLSYERALTIITESIYTTAATGLERQTAGAISVSSVTSKCDYTQVTCTDVKSCSFQQLRRPVRPSPTFKPIVTQSGRNYPTFRAWTARPTARSHGNHGWTAHHHHPGRGHDATTTTQQRFHRPATNRPREPHNHGHREPATAWTQHSTHSPANQWSGPEEQSCGNCAAQKLKCCKIGGEEIGCCPAFVQEFMYGIVDLPLERLTPKCKSSLLQGKSQCLDEYVQCMDEVFQEADSFLDKDLTNPRTLASLGTVVKKLTSCTGLKRCLMTTHNGKACGPANTCSVSTRETSLFNIGLPNSGHYNICMPIECRTNDNIHQMASLLFDFTCGPYCVLDDLAAQARLAELGDPSTCPVEDLSLTCYGTSNIGRITAVQRELQKSDVCEAALSLADNLGSATSGEIKDGKKFYNNILNAHNAHNKNKKSSEWSNPWFIVGVVSGGLFLIIGIVLVVRWQIYSRRRRAQARIFTYANLNDESATPDVPE